jgi:hypothetical protein
MTFTTPPIRFAVIGVNGAHIHGQVRLMLNAGAELVSFYAPEPELAATFAQSFPQARLASSAKEILYDEMSRRWASRGTSSKRQTTTTRRAASFSHT